MKKEKQEKLDKEIYQRIENELAKGYIDKAKEIIDYAKKQGKQLELKKISEEALIKGFEAWLPIDLNKAKKVIDFAKEIGKEIEIPKDVYLKEVEYQIKEGNLMEAEQIISFAKRYGTDLSKSIPKEFYIKNVKKRIKKKDIGDIEIAKKIVDLAKQQGIEIKKEIPKDFYIENIKEAIKEGYMVIAEKIVDFAKEQGIEIDLKSFLKSGKKAKGYEKNGNDRRAS